MPARQQQVSRSMNKSDEGGSEGDSNKRYGGSLLWRISRNIADSFAWIDTEDEKEFIEAECGGGWEIKLLPGYLAIHLIVNFSYLNMIS